MNRETLLAQAGARRDVFGAVSMPIYQTATFAHPALGQSTGYDYSRSGNPTRTALEETLAQLDGGARACTFASGLAAIDAILRLFQTGDEIIVTEDLYGGTFRLFEKIYRQIGITAIYVDTSDPAAVAAALTKNVKAIFVELPTNPLLKVADLTALAALARDRQALLIVDNTFLTPALLRPIEHGADLVVYSGTKYLSGHNDIIAGAVVAKTAELGERLYFYQNAAGAILAPLEAWLFLRGLKTLALRVERAERNALAVAKMLARHPRVKKVHYAGLPTDAGYERLKKQASGAGAMAAFSVDDPALVPAILANVKVFIFAESLGGVESLITFPAVQTHAEIAPEIRERLGITDRLLRISVGIENVHDLVADLESAINN
ncbi:cystathionine gamma-synthase [Planctomycetales bacterium]|nr:cystathionine gamma-synthase [Planctomycetales bacterium]GHS97628.1 cystathionine gamma-synthase [Planctomycetales bacterium]GHT04147.1 cystathionine gamma-synthase [Planctomycetales bacterium]